MNGPAVASSHPHPTGWQTIAGTALATALQRLFAQFLAGVTVAYLVVFSGGRSDVTLAAVLAAPRFQLAMLAVGCMSWFVVLLFAPDAFADIRLRFARSPLLARPFWPSLAAGLVGLSLLALAEPAVAAATGSEPRHYLAIVQALTTGALAPWEGLIFVALAVAVAPLFEEIVFRGLLYTSLQTRLGPSAATVLSATAFAAAHVQTGAPAVAAAALASGVLLAWVYRSTGNLMASVVLHSFGNALWLALAAIRF